MNKTTFHNIKTERLLLDAPSADDRTQVFSYASEKSVLEHCLMPCPYTQKTADDWIAKSAADNAEGKNLVWAVRRLEDNEFLGAIGLHFDFENSTAEVGYWLGKDFQNYQYGREALDAVVHSAFNEYGINRLWANVFTNNFPSILILEWCGFQPEGCLREHKFHACSGKFRDVLIYGIIKRDFDKRNPEK